MSDRLLDSKEIAALVSKSVLTLRKDVYRRPESLPPRTILPGNTRALVWRQSDVDAWFSSLTTAPAPVEAKRCPGRPPIYLQKSTEKSQQKENTAARRGRPPKVAQAGGAK